MATINEFVIKEQIISSVEKLLINYTSLDFINKTEFPNLIEDLKKELDKILKND